MAKNGFKKDLPELHLLGVVGSAAQVGSDSKFTNYLMNLPRNPEHTINGES